MCESGYQFGLDLNSEPQLPAACSLERCGDVAMKAGDECCDNQILDKTRPETCCTMAKALERPAGRSALEHSNGALI